MDKFKTIGLGGLPLVLDDLRWFFGRLGSPNEGIYQAFNNLLRGFGDNFIVQGVVASGSSPNVAITEGWVLLDGELIKVDAQTGIDTTTDNKFVKVTTFDSRGNKTFQNATVEDTYEKNRAVVQGTTGNLDFDAKTCLDLKNQADFLSSTVVLKKKIIEIGDWNMDTTVNVSISHGLADHTKIRSVQAMIRDDSDVGIAPLNRFVDFANGLSDGGINVINATTINLVRRTGGLFDTAAFDSTSFNRGFIIFEFEI